MNDTLSLLFDLDVDELYEEQIDDDVLREVVVRALTAEGVTGEVSVSLMITDDDEIRSINATHRGIDEPTDVLSFPLEEKGDSAGSFVVPPGEPRHLGDIVISFPRAESQSREFGHALRRELAYLAVHGTLHLLGYDHETEEDRTTMRILEEGALTGIPRE